MKRFVLLLFVCLTLTSCADRTRYNCDDITNPNGITERRCQ
jgi:hypothetical protein